MPSTCSTPGARSPSRSAPPTSAGSGTLRASARRGSSGRARRWASRCSGSSPAEPSRNHPRRGIPMVRDYLLEIGCEEIPAGFVGPALWFGGQQFEGMLKKARLSFRKVDIYGTPRRLAYVIRDLEDRQAASKETVMGPPKSVGLDPAGKPTKAALGFARSQGIEFSALTVVPTDRGDCLVFVREEAARPVV